MNFFGVTKKYDFERGNLMPGALLMALSLIGIALLNGIPSLVENLIFGRYGVYALASYGVSNMVLSYVTAFSGALMVAANVVVARSCGKRDPKRVSASVNTTLIISPVLGVLLALVLLVGGSSFVRLYSYDPEIIYSSVGLIRFNIPYIFFTTVYCGLIGSMYGMGDALRPLLITVVKLIVRIVLTVVFTVVLSMGYNCLPLINAFAEVIGVVLALVCFICGNGEAKLNFSAGFHGKSLLYVIVITLTAGLGTLGLNAPNSMFSAVISGYGTFAVSAYTIANSVLGLVRFVPAALIPMILTVVAQCSGGDDTKKAFKNALITVAIATVPALFFSLVVLVFGPVIGRIYMSYDDYRVMDMMGRFIRLMVFGEFFSVAALVLAAAVRARGGAILSALASAVPSLIAAVVMIAMYEYDYNYDGLIGFGGFVAGFAPFICCAVMFVIVNVIAIALSKPKPAPAYDYAPGMNFDPATGRPLNQPVQPKMNFDPMTGKPLNQPAVPKMNFDPMTGKPLNQTEQTVQTPDTNYKDIY